ncbi:hypothetical protein D3C81_1762430 [compost metagenome]
MIHPVGTADEVGVFIFEFTALAFTHTFVEVGEECRLQRLAQLATGTAELFADDFLVNQG